MKLLAQLLAENGHEPDVLELVPGIAISTSSFEHAKDEAFGGRTPVSVHATLEGEWLATLRLEDLLAMIPSGYGLPDGVE